MTGGAQPLYVGSYNIRYDNEGDVSQGNSWQRRCPIVCGQLNFEHPDVFGAQEVLDHQLHDMLRLLDGYGYIGVGRDDGKTQGEYAAIFYDKQKIRLVDNGHFWLSQTPEKPSLGWDAACIRICTWGLFEDMMTGLQFYFFNLHMDHVGVVARREAAKLVVQRIGEIAGKERPVVLTGDFNVDQTDEIYTIFTRSGLLLDSYEHARLRFAENGTFNGYKQDVKTASRIDHVFVSPHFDIDRYGLLTNTYWLPTETSGQQLKGNDAPQEISLSPYERRLPSDHYPVFVRLKNKQATAMPVDDEQSPVSKVNPFIGTGGNGHVFLGANVPFGMVQLGPTQYTRGWDWCSGYHYSDSLLIGFGHMHLSGTGIGELGDVSFLPVLQPEECEVKFSHKSEYVRPGYYSVMLSNGIHVDLTATERTGLHRYTLPADVRQGYLRLNMRQGIGWDKMTGCSMQQESATCFSGYRLSSGWANNQQVYFVAEFSRPVTVSRAEGDTVRVLSFANTGEPLLVRVGLSAVSVEGAKANLKAEMPGWNFREVVSEANRKWQAQLEKIKVTGGTADEQAIFYTALYHTMTAPSVFCDVDGRYRGSDGKVHQGQYTNYTTFSLWDTYRAAHPLMTLIHPEMQEDLAMTMLNIWREQGKLPVWHLMGCETNCMVGNPAIPVLADMVLKGLTKQRDDAMEAMKASALLDERGLSLLKQYGYIPCDLYDEHETVGRGLEYALADWCVARVAQQLGRKADMKLFDRRAQSYRRYFDRQALFMRGLDSQGHFREPFSPFQAAPANRDYTEGNAWQYTWLVPHDVHGLVSLFGSEQRFTEKLDSLFIVEGNKEEKMPLDISGLIGQYAHGNEPSHHVLYMYNYVGQPWKGARLIRQTMSELYRNNPDGLCGNEDVGQMSAWYILSAMGFYQVEPAGGKYVIGTPLFSEVQMNVGGGKTFTVKAIGNSEKNIYVQSARLNGKPYTRSYIIYEDMVKGGTLELLMGPEPSDFGTKTKDRP